jgi:uncharacterized Zn finger protein
MANLWLPPSACPHGTESLRVEIKAADQAIVQCFRCGSVWSHETVPLALLESLKPVIELAAQASTLEIRA